MIDEHHDFGWRCPRCGKKLDGHTACQEGKSKPAAGDVTICLYCHSVFEVSAELQLLPAGLDIVNTAEVQRALLALRKVKAKCN